jgi:hypothetical protein
MRAVRTFHQLSLRLLNVSHQILNRTHLHSPLPPKLQAPIPPQHARCPELRLPLYLLPVLHHLTYDPNRRLARQPTELHRRLRMPNPLSHTPLLSPQRQHMPGPPQVVPRHARARQRPAGQRAVVRADARGGLREVRVYGDGVGGAARVLALGDHGRQVQLVGEGGQDGRAHVPGGVADHEGHLLGCHVGRGDYEVALVLAREIVQDDDELAILWPYVSGDEMMGGGLWEGMGWFY